MFWVIVLFIVFFAIGLACLKFISGLKKDLENFENNIEEPYEPLSRINWDLFNEEL